ncbi:hypothetical protein BH09PLA1_BH09PLA1_13190 [soil metagenome]
MNATTNSSLDIGRGAIFFDDACGFCTGLARRMRPTLERRGFKLIGLHSPVALELTSATVDDLMGEIYLTAADRTVYRGVDAVLFILSAWPRLRPICAIARWPGINALLRLGYRTFARNRYRISDACAIGPPRMRSKFRAIARWLPLIVLPTIALLFARALPAWAYMLTISLAIFYACKWLTLLARSPRVLKESYAISSALSYVFFWTGMDARRFLGPRDAAPPPRRAWSVVAIKMFIGAAMLWIVPLAISAPLLRGWSMMIGLALLVHFGIFQMIALAWQSRRVHADALMLRPARSTSLGELWGRRWNTAFVVLARDFVFDPLRRRTNAIVALIVTFLVSGIIHDIAISIPARGGYGLPTLYFLIQCAGLFAQRTNLARRAGFGRGFRGWIFTMLVSVLPMPLLFHAPFVLNVISPMLEPLHRAPRGVIDHLPLLLMLAGLMHLCITSAGIVMTLVLDWRKSLAPLTALTRHIIWTHGGFVLATIVGFGVISVLQPTTLASGQPLARAICAFIALFWAARLAIGFTVFDAKPFLTSRALTLAYHGLNLVIGYFVIVYGLAATLLD